MARSTVTPTRGPYVALVVLGLILATTALVMFRATFLPRWGSAPIEQVVGTAQSTQLQVTVGHEDCGRSRGARVEVDESAEHVVLRGQYDRRGGCDDIALASVVVVDLASALAGREIRIQGGTDTLECRSEQTAVVTCRRLPVP